MAEQNHIDWLAHAAPELLQAFLRMDGNATRGDT